MRGRHRGTPRRERKCLVCGSGDVEIEQHFIEECQDGRVDDERCNMWE